MVNKDVYIQLYTPFVSRHFRRSYLKANKVKKEVKEQGKLNMNITLKCTDAVYSKLSKSVHSCRNYSLQSWLVFVRHITLYIISVFLVIGC